MNAPQDKPRWHYRFASFSRALARLREGAARESLDELQQVGLVQLFNITFALAWKVLRERMEEGGLKIPRPVMPRSIIKEAFVNEFIDDGELWIAMLDDRNITAHEYDEAKFKAATDSILRDYLPALNLLHEQLRAEAGE